MFSNYEGNYGYWLGTSDILAKQEEVFYTFIGLYPNEKIRFKSPFRPDSKPGCRFSYYNGIWYLVDNAGYKNKLNFNCIQLVENLFECDFKAACRIIYFNLNKNSSCEKSITVGQGNSIRIDFKAKEWTRNNYFTKNFGLPVEYLNLQPYYLVESYLTNTKTDNALRLNRFYNPDVYDVIAYNFEETGHTKLYFPERELKFYSNATFDDIFGWHRIGDYLFNSENKTLFITKSGKDEMLLNYFFNVNSIALQGEVISKLPDKLLRVLKYFDTIVINMDNDEVGRRSNQVIKQIILNHYPQMNIRIMLTDEKDISDQLLKNKKYQ